MDGQKIAIIGSGLIGNQWAMLFAAAKFKVVLYDLSKEILERAMTDIKNQLQSLKEKGLLRGELSIEEQLAAIDVSTNLKDTLANAFYAQECTPEHIKKQVFDQIDKNITTDSTIIGSSTSTHTPSSFLLGYKHSANYLVAHPVNPPSYVRLVEIVPSPATDPKIVPLVRSLMDKIGQAPIVLKKELNGHSLNRIQYAILAEFWHQLEQDAISVEDIDTIMKEGLGTRYAFMGPCETLHLKALGTIDYCKKYQSNINKVLNTLKHSSEASCDPDSPLALRIEQELVKKIPKDRLSERMQWRNDRLAALAKLKLDEATEEKGKWESSE